MRTDRSRTTRRLASTVRLSRVAVGLLVFVGLFIVQFAVLLAVSPRLFWSDDAMTQYSPAMWWLGRHQQGLVPPLMNPELGGAASFATDMQYGVLDPLHWVWQAVASRFSDMAVFSAVYGCVCLLIVGSGVLVQLLSRRVPPVLAASVAVGVSGSGFLLWFGSDWWPLLWSAGFVCWIWNGLRMRSWGGLLVLGVAVGALFSSGYPYFLSFAVVLVVAHLVETVIAARSWRVLVDRVRLLQYTAIAGGLVYALPTLLTMLQSAAPTARPIPDPFLGNSGLGVPNFVDVVLGSPTLFADANYGGFPLAVTYTFVVTVPLVAFIRWERFLRVSGALTGAVIAGLAIAATQLPAVVFGFRNPLIYLTMVEIFLPITLIVLVVHARRISRRRIVFAALIVVAQVLLTVLRAPNFVGWSGVELVVLGIALVALLVQLRPSASSTRRVRAGAAASLAVLTIASPLLAMGSLIWLQNVEEHLGLVPQQPAAARQPFRVEPGWGVDPARTDAFADRSIAPGSAASVYDFRAQDIDAMYSSGAFAGNQNLFADASLGYGYGLAVYQRDRALIDCRGHFGSACGPETPSYECPERLGAACWPDGLLTPAPVPGGHQRWIDVLSQPVVLVNADAPGEVVAYLRAHWRSVTAPDGWLQFEKRRPLPGRISIAHRVKVAATGWRTGLGRIGSSMEHYTVTTGDSSGSLVFYTTYWPGLEATVDGRAVPVSSLDGSVLRVELPAGLRHARLDITYAPIGSKVLMLLIVGPAIIVLAAVIAGFAAAHARYRSRAAGTLQQAPTPAGEVR